jgi:hypothetical protein
VEGDSEGLVASAPLPAWSSFPRFRQALFVSRLALACAALAHEAGAADYSELERRTIARAVPEGSELEPEPEGKLIESINIVRRPVFDDEDPVPDLVNLLHYQTRERVLARELLFKSGEPYRDELVAETERVLRAIPQLGVVLIVALKGSTPERVRVLVIARDVWSLRLNYELQGSLAPGLLLTGFFGVFPFRSSRLGSSSVVPKVNYMAVNLSEDNFLGYHTRLGGLFTLRPDTYSLGPLIAQPRLFDTAVDGVLSGGIYFNRRSGASEGSYGLVSLYQPLRSIAQRWGFWLGAAWAVQYVRFYKGVEPQFFDADVTAEDDRIPHVYHAEIVRAGGEVTRSFGRKLKRDITFGVELARRKFQAAAPPEVARAALAEFVREQVRMSDTRLSPFVQLELRTSEFLTTRDVETLSLQESFVLGPATALRLYPALRAVSSSRDLLGVVSWAGHTLPLSDGFLRVVAGSSIEHADAARHQATAQAALRIVSPRFELGRFVLDAVTVSTYRNYLNTKLQLGGDTRPRGYPISEFTGKSASAGSVEFRSGAVNILSARVGAVAFYDVGGAYESPSLEALHQSVGVGLRILFPQVNRDVFRLDWAAPLTRGAGDYRPFPGGFFFSFYQAFGIPGLRLPQLLGAETTLIPQSE